MADDSFETLAFALRDAYFALRNGMDDILSMGTTRGQRVDDSSLLALLNARGDMRVEEVARGLGRTVPSVSRQLNSMEQRGLVYRERQMDDRRGVMVRLSPTARVSAQERARKARTLYQRCVRGLSAIEQQELLRMLRVVHQNATHLRDDGVEENSSQG